MSHFDEFEEVFNDLMKKAFDTFGGGFKESVYQNTIAFEMRNLSWSVAKEVNFPKFYEDVVEVGTVRFDLVFNHKYILEFNSMQKVGAKEENQLKRYLNLANLTVGFIVNVSLDRYLIISVGLKFLSEKH